MTWGRPLRLLLTFVLCLSATRCAEAVDLDAQIKAQQAEMDRIARMSQFHQTEIQSAQKQQKNYSDQLDQLDRRITLADGKIKLLNLQIAKNDRETTRLQNEIEARTAKIAELQALLEKRLVAIYKYGSVADYNLLLSASNAVDLGNITYMLGRIAKSDQTAIGELNAERQALDKDKVDLEENRAQMARRRAALASARASARKDVQAKQAIVGQLEKNEQAHRAALRELQADQQELQNTINRLLAQKAEEERRRQSQGKPAMPAVVHKGRLIWPLASHTISSPFGERIHPQFKTRIMHTGIDIPSPKGTPVWAAGAGTVLYAGWIRGYGQIVIIDHGRNISTVYAHLSAIDVQEGQRVNTGQTIGRVGNTGVATGYHLHFEVRVDGVAKNPVNYLPR